MPATVAPTSIVAAFCRNKPCPSLSIQGASRVRCAGLTPALASLIHPLGIQKRENTRLRVALQYEAAVCVLGLRNPGSFEAPLSDLL